MKQLVILACALCAINAIPVPSDEQPKELELLQIPLKGDQELDILQIADNEGKVNERNKRTIGMLRELFPELSKQVEGAIQQKIQMLLPILFRTIGPILLRSGLGGGGATTSVSDDDDDDDDDDFDSGSDLTSRTGADGRKVSISLPTFPPDTDDDDDDDDDIPAIADSSSSTSTTTTESSSINIGGRIGVDDNEGDTPTDTPDTDTETDTDTDTDSTTTKSNDDDSNLATATGKESPIDLAALTDRLETLSRVARQAAAAQAVDQTNEVEPDSSASDTEEVEANAPAIDELSLDSEEPDDNRNKRFLSFGLGGGGGAAGGGSGNFLFDIIRRTADNAARAAGTVYRVVAGTESFNAFNADKTVPSQSTASTTSSQSTTGKKQQQQRKAKSTDLTLAPLDGRFSDGLVSGSSGTQQSDEQANAPAPAAQADGSAAPAQTPDGYTEGIPGPVTRLFVLANRGIANLIQDLILRVAQTSERVVNFKARLITSLI